MHGSLISHSLLYLHGLVPWTKRSIKSLLVYFNKLIQNLKGVISWIGQKVKILKGKWEFNFAPPSF